MEMISASIFSMNELADIYNQARADYMIPMQISPADLQEYIRYYDVALEHSFVALDETGAKRGVAMLGLRKDRTWITRLGVIPSNRRSGVGDALMRRLLEESERLGIRFSMLEVIKNNTPAHKLFLKLGFYEVGELLILRRPPAAPPDPMAADARRLDRHEALDLVGRDRGTQPWTNQSESLFNLQDVSGLKLTLADGSRGWIVYQRQKFTLTRFIYKTEAGDPETVAFACLTHLHHQYPRLDTHIENIQVSDPHLPAFYKMGYVESFRRIEMWRGDPPGFAK